MTTRNKRKKTARVQGHSKTSSRGTRFSIDTYLRRPRRKTRRRVPRVIRPEVSKSIHELSKDDVEYSGAFDFNPHKPQIENAIYREGDVWSVTLPPSEAKLKYPEMFEQYDRDFEVTWHTHPRGGFPYLPSPQDITGFVFDSAVLGQENHLVYIEETETVILVNVPRNKARQTLRKNRNADAFSAKLDKEWNTYNALPMKQRVRARRRMMNRWGKKYGFTYREFSIHDPIVVMLIPQEPKRIKRKV